VGRFIAFTGVHAGNSATTLAEASPTMSFRFDRGTLEWRSPIEPSPALRRHLTWDARTDSWRAPAYHLRAIRSLAPDSCAAALDPVPGAGTFVSPPLRPYQGAAFQCWRDQQCAGLVAMPTGAGKTRLACAIMAWHQVSTLILVPTRALLAQWRTQIQSMWSGAIGCVGDGESRLEKVTLMTFASAYLYMARLGNRFALLIVDEVHHFGSGQRDEALMMCAAPWRLGLSATLPDGDARSRLHHWMGPTLAEVSLPEISAAYLAPYALMHLRVRLDHDEETRYRELIAIFSTVYQRWLRTNAGAPWSAFVYSAMRDDQGRQALEAFRASRRLIHLARSKLHVLSSILVQHSQQKTLVFTADNSSAYAIARKELVFPFTCDIGRRERKWALDAFAAGTIRALVSSQVLNEGVDIPDAQVAVILGGRGAQREYLQRVGRVLRPHPGKVALIYDISVRDTFESRERSLHHKKLKDPR
jgi:superfamily II DNA or RNA helicase